MATFAKLNNSNVVTQVISVNNNELLKDGIESEEKGIQFCKSVYGEDSIWKQTSYNTKNGKYLNNDNTLAIDQSKSFRKNHARIGYIYDEERDAFIPPKPFNSWIFNESTCNWDAPIPYPVGQGPDYIWNEENLNWEKIIIS